MFRISQPFSSVAVTLLFSAKSSRAGISQGYKTPQVENAFVWELEAQNWLLSVAVWHRQTSCRKRLPSLTGLTAAAQEKRRSVGKFGWVRRGVSTYRSNSRRHTGSGLPVWQASPYLYRAHRPGPGQENGCGRCPARLSPGLVRISASLSGFTLMKCARGI